MQQSPQLKQVPQHGEISFDFFKKYFKNFRDNVLTTEALTTQQLLILAIMVQRAKQIRLFSVPSFLDKLGIALPTQENDDLRASMEQAVADVEVTTETLGDAGFSIQEIDYLLSLLTVKEPKKNDRGAQRQPRPKPDASTLTPKRKLYPQPSSPPFRSMSGVLAKQAEVAFNKFLTHIEPSQQSEELAATILDAVARGESLPARDWLVVQKDKSGKVSIVIYEDRNYEDKLVGAPLGEKGGRKALELARALQKSDFSHIPVICTVSFEPNNNRTLAQSFQVVAHMPAGHTGFV